MSSKSTAIVPPNHKLYLSYFRVRRLLLAMYQPAITYDETKTLVATEWRTLSPFEKKFWNDVVVL